MIGGKNLFRFSLCVLAMGVLWGGTAALAAPTLMPFVLASRGQGEMKAEVDKARAALEAQGFEIVGGYAPYPTATVIAFTNDALKSTAAASVSGGYGAVLRASVTKVGAETQVAYTNPSYMAHAFRMTGEAAGVLERLQKALGEGTPFGPAEGLSAEQLRNYHYMFGMEYFDDPSELGGFGSFAEAVDAVEQGLQAKRGGASKVYRVNLPGKEETVFGVALTVGCSGDEYIMSRIDFKKIRSTPHLPYEILVSGKKVYALFARFRIAISFPDLSMMGDNSFFSIMCAPGEIEDALKMVVRGEGKK